MTERAELMRIYRSNGISSISLMRDHYNKYDDGGDIQPSDATFRATLTNPVNSYRSNAPAGIGDAAITKATGLLNPITAATLTAAPLGAYGIYKAIENKKAFGGNIYDGKGTKSNQMNVSFPLKANTKDPSQIQIEQYLYRPPNYDTAKTYTPLYNDKFKNTQDQIDILNALKTTSRRPNRLQNERSWNRFQDRLNVTDSLGWSKVQASAIISRDGFETNFVEDTIQPGGDHAKGALQVHGDREKDMRSRGYNPLSFRDAYKYVDEVIKTDKTFNTHGGKYISGDSMRSMWNNPNVTPEALNKAFIQWFSRSGKPFYKENSEAAKSVYNYILKFNRDEKALIR